MAVAPVKDLLDALGLYYWLWDRYIDLGGRPGYRGYYGRKYLRGEGLEIGALHFPQIVKPGTRVRYVDRLNHEELIARYPELEAERIVRPSIIDNGFDLLTVPACSQDFVIANHVLEHSPNPFQTLKNWARLVRENGHILVTVPIADRCFDKGRTLTPVEHMYEDYTLCEKGDLATFRERNLDHYREWVSISANALRQEQNKPALTEQEQADLPHTMSKNNAEIHFHTFSHSSFRAFLQLFIERIDPNFVIRAVDEQGIEVVAVLHRTSQRNTD